MTVAESAHRQSSLAFYLARVEQARAEGAAAGLAHVRERCERSEAAWQALADRAQRGERMDAGKSACRQAAGDSL